PRGRLLEAAIDYIATRGVSDLSLRELAAAIGTSHRMLIHHFGSMEGLWVEVIRTVEQRQRDLLAEIVPDPAQALQARPGTTALLDGIVDSWLEPGIEYGLARGMTREQAAAGARLGVAV